MTEINKTFTNKIEEIFLKICNSDEVEEKISKNFSKNFPNKYSNKITPKKIAVAVSGGCDSLALLALLSDFFLQKKHEKIVIYAITIDHKMRKNSSSEAKDLKKILNIFPTSFKLHHRILTIAKNKIPQRNIEAKLREIRYELMINFCKKNKIPIIFLGHHLGDIAENFLIRLFRGSSIEGLASISEVKEIQEIKLIRPLLNFNKQQLKDFLISKKISWFEDESNNDEKFLRNKIRNFLASFPEEKILQTRLKNTGDYFFKMREFFDEKTAQEKSRISTKNKDSSYIINREELKKLPEEIALKILAEILVEISEKIYKPRREKLQRFFDYLCTNQDLKPRNFYNCMLKKINNNEVLIYRQLMNSKKLN